MLTKLKITILGCGSSQGVPRVGLGWGDCDPNEPKNRRLRCAILVEDATSKVVIDTGPDCREQLISANVSHLDGAILTHDHADHCHGIDDLRPLALMHRKRVDVYMDDVTAATMNLRFGYCFKTPEGGNYPPILNDVRIEDYKQFNVNTLVCTPLPVGHGKGVKALALRFGTFAYMPDVKTISNETANRLRGLDLLIIDCLRYIPHQSHFNLEETLYWIKELAPKRSILTNLHCDLDYNRLKSELPPHIEPAYDGMEILV